MLKDKVFNAHKISKGNSTQDEQLDVVLLSDAEDEVKRVREETVKPEIKELMMAVLPGLMLRHREMGYSDVGAINEAYALAKYFFSESLTESEG